MFGVLGWIVFGLIVGAVAKLLMPGRDPGGFIVTILRGIAGAVLGGFLGRALGWYGEGDAPAVFHSMEPAWNDRNLKELAKHVRSPLVFAHIRASTGTAVQQTNCHPFRHGRWLWMHNGLIRDFHRVKRELRFAVDPDLYAEIEGSTDSETFFYLALTLGLEDDPPRAVQDSLSSACC